MVARCAVRRVEGLLEVGGVANVGCVGDVRDVRALNDAMLSDGGAWWVWTDQVQEEGVQARAEAHR